MGEVPIQPGAKYVQKNVVVPIDMEKLPYHNVIAFVVAPKSQLTVLKETTMVKKVTKPAADEVDESPKPAVKKAVKKTAAEPAPVAKAAKAKAEPKEKDDNLVTLSEIAAELGIDPRAARVKLRKSEFNKGDGRWAWELGSKEHRAVAAFLTPKEAAE